MCRHFGYLGEPVTLASLVFGPPHSLAVQAATPKDMRGGGTVNVDGFGLGWYAPPTGTADPMPAAGQANRYRWPLPIWQDAAFAELCRATEAVGALGAVRSATPGMEIAERACAPFTDGHWLFSLNGRIVGWPDAASTLAGTLELRELLAMDALTDSALLWTALRSGLAAAPDRPGQVLASLVTRLLSQAPGSRLNTMLTDGTQLCATTVTHSLWSRHRADGVLLASEPFDDDPAWQPIPDGQLVVADRTGVRVSPLPLPAAGPRSDRPQTTRLADR